MVRGVAMVVVNRSADVVFAAISDITRMGEWNPEVVGTRWVGQTTGPSVGATFETAKKTGRRSKKVTTSVVTACASGEAFEFVTDDSTTWRYKLEPASSGTKVTATFSDPWRTGVKGFVYETVLRRPAAMINGMPAMLSRIKAALESQ